MTDCITAKVGFDFNDETSTIKKVVLPYLQLGEAKDIVVYGLHLVFILLMIAANILMLRFYVLSM